MGPFFKFEIPIVAVDRASRVLRGVGRTVAAVMTRNTKFDKWLAGTGRSVRNFGLGAIALSGAAAAGFGALVTHVASAGDEIAKTADRLGIGVEALQEYRFAAERSGVAGNVFTKSLEKLGKNAADAAAGVGEGRAAFAALGIELTDAGGRMRRLDDLLPEVADALAGVENESVRNALAARIFGEEGMRMTGMLSQGSKGLRALRAEARALGGVMSEDTARASERLSDEIQNLKTGIAGLTFSALGPLMPALAGITAQFREWLVTFQPRIAAFAESFGAALPARVDAITDAFARWWPQIETVFGWVGSLIGKLDEHQAMWLVVGAVVGGVVAAIVGSVALAVGVIGAIPLAVAAIIGAITATVVAFWDEITAGFKTVAGWLGFGDNEVKDWSKHSFVPHPKDQPPTEPSAPSPPSASVLDQAFGAEVDRALAQVHLHASAAETARMEAGRASVDVSFTNMPPGTRTSAEAEGLDLSVHRGYGLPALAGIE